MFCYDAYVSSCEEVWGDISNARHLGSYVSHVSSASAVSFCVCGKSHILDHPRLQGPLHFLPSLAHIPRPVPVVRDLHPVQDPESLFRLHTPHHQNSQRREVQNQ